MVYFYWIAGIILALAWFSRIVDAALGMPSVADVSLPEWDRNPVSATGNPRVSIIVPARNEEETIEQALTSLLALDYDNYEVLAVNDRSTDSTGEIMERVAESQSQNPHFSQKLREMGHPGQNQTEHPHPVAQNATRVGHPLSSPNLRVVHHRELPAGWLGKTHAMWTAANLATGDWLLFTDADVLFKPDSLRRSLAYAETVDVAGVGGIGLESENPRARGPQLLNRRLRRVRERAAARQHQLARAVMYQPARHLQSQCAKSAGDPVGRVGAQMQAGRLRQIAANKPLDEPRRRTQRNLVLAVGTQQFIGKGADRAHSVSTRQVDQPTPHFRMLKRHHPAEAPERSLR